MRSIREWLAEAATTAEIRPDGGTHGPEPDRPDAHTSPTANNPLGRISSAATAQAAKTISTAKSAEEVRREMLEYLEKVKADMARTAAGASALGGGLIGGWTTTTTTAAPYGPTSGFVPPPPPMPSPISLEYDPFNENVVIRTRIGRYGTKLAALEDLVSGKSEIAPKTKKSASVDKRAATALAKEEALEGKVASQASSLSVLWEFIEEHGLMAEAVAWCDERGASATT